MTIEQVTKRLVLFSALLLCHASPLFSSEQGLTHWSYQGEGGPEHWGELTEKYQMCSLGSNQSPIDLVTDIHVGMPELVFDYYSSTIDQINNGHTIQQNIKPGSFLKIPGLDMSFELKQFHFHSPSEHTINGQSFPMEVHFVHADEQGALLVVGVLFDEGKEHPVLNRLWSFMPENPGETSIQPIGIEETDLLPPTRDYYTYSGSLTTPPCSEGVRWVVLKTTVQASAEQISTFKGRVGTITNRPVQPRNARLVVD